MSPEPIPCWTRWGWHGMTIRNGGCDRMARYLHINGEYATEWLGYTEDLDGPDQGLLAADRRAHGTESSCRRVCSASVTWPTTRTSASGIPTAGRCSTPAPPIRCGCCRPGIGWPTAAPCPRCRGAVGSTPTARRVKSRPRPSADVGTVAGVDAGAHRQ